MTKTEEAAIDAMHNNFTYQTLIKQFPKDQELLDQVFKAGFADGALWALDRINEQKAASL